MTLDGTTATVGISDYAQVSTKREDTRDVNWKLIYTCMLLAILQLSIALELLHRYSMVTAYVIATCSLCLYIISCCVSCSIVHSL